MRYSMVRLKETADLGQLATELASSRIEMSLYGGDVHDAAFEITVESALLVRIAQACLEGVVPGYGSRLVLDHIPLSDTSWRLADSAMVDLYDHPELFVHARLLERVRAACREHIARKEGEYVDLAEQRAS